MDDTDRPPPPPPDDEATTPPRHVAPADRRDTPTGSLLWYDRGDLEFSRATAYFDATYALATTLLVTTLDPGQDGWSTWSGLQGTVGQQLIAFAISFAVVAAYWWLNHRFVSSLERLSPRIIGGVIVGLAFIVLLPFTTEGLALGSTVPTIVYALNVALVSLSASALCVIAWRQDLYRVRPDRALFIREQLGGLITPVVFLASIPIAAFVSVDLARWSWILLFPLNVLDGQAVRRRTAALAAEPDAVPHDQG